MFFESAVFKYRFLIGSEGSSNVSRLHELNGEISGMVTTILPAGLRSLDTAVSADCHVLCPYA